MHLEFDLFCVVLVLLVASCAFAMRLGPRSGDNSGARLKGLLPHFANLELSMVSP